MTLSNKKIKIFQTTALQQEVAGTLSKEKQLVTENEETLQASELLLLQINSGTNEILFI